ncbi:MAG: hypothetical protein RL204_2333, partial [Bacteroidota bacterium]
MEKFKEFKPTSWSIDNKTTIYLITIFITLMGIISYRSIPKEQFPDIVIPTIYVQTILPGTAPKDMENLVTKHLEKQMKSLSGVKKVTSQSLQDFSIVMVEFNTTVEVADAKQKVDDAVDKADSDLPNDPNLRQSVIQVEFSEMPILFVNISGDYDLAKLKKYAESLQDKIEGLKEITRVDIVGALDREIQVNVDMYKAQAAHITMSDIENAIKYENMTISGGIVKVDDLNRSINIKGEFESVSEIENIIINSMTGSTVYLKDV